MKRARGAAVLFNVASLAPTPYVQAWSWQRAILSARTSAPTDAARAAVPDVVIALQHAPVYTLGRAASVSDLRFGGGGACVDEAADLPAGPGGADVIRVDRGGKITYHGPGQLVVYPLLDLRRHREDLHWYVRSIEDVLVRVLAREASLHAFARTGAPGVWVGAPGRERKIAAVGMNASKWATAHGFALNVAPNLAAFDAIVPCGIDDRQVTSIAAELGASAQPPSFDAITRAVLTEFEHVFDVDLDATGGGTIENFCERLEGRGISDAA